VIQISIVCSKAIHHLDFLDAIVMLTHKTMRTFWIKP
jgi:hypothetical protein